ncbi:hypothetical protein ACEQPO_07675 [Bacillus sp. SL00103]
MEQGSRLYSINGTSFVGALMLTVVFPMKDPAGRPRNAFEWFVSKYSVLLLVGILQEARQVRCSSLGLVLRWKASGASSLAIVVSLTFLAIIQS